MTIPAVHVASANLDTVGYHRGDLYVRFQSGQSYKYEKVPFPVYQALINAESIGQYFHKNVRNAFFYAKLDFDPFAQMEATA